MLVFLIACANVAGLMLARGLQRQPEYAISAQLFAMRLLLGFSFVGCLLALAGIYSVLSLSVGSRRREIAVRMAIGAQRRNILSLVLQDGMRLLLGGLLLGTGAALMLARLFRSLLFEVNPMDPNLCWVWLDYSF